MVFDRYGAAPAVVQAVISFLHLALVELLLRAGQFEQTGLDRLEQPRRDLAPAGFGQQVRDAMDQRREHHIEQGDATRARQGRIVYRQGGSVSWRLRRQRGLGM